MRVVALIAALLVLAANAAAQVVVGTVIEQSSNAPVRGAFVVLLNAQGGRVAGTLTDERGGFVFRAQAGSYSVRAERIGHRTATAGPFALQPDQTHSVRVAMEIAALRLKEIDVRGENRCVSRPDQSKQTADVWAEARKALTVAVWLETRGIATFQSRSYETNLDLDLLPIGPATYKFVNLAGKQPYRAVDPDTAARFGYVRDLAEGRVLYGLDAELLLSTSFLSQHCFKLVRRGDRVGLIGLGFEPIRGQKLPDIKGTLWLDDRSAELRFIEYGYTGLDDYEDARFAGGRTDFEQLDNGAWIVRRWYIRSPRLVLRSAVRGPEVLGAREEGAEIIAARVGAAPGETLMEPVSIDGFVVDSVTGRPLEGASVYLSGTPYRVTTGIAGRFRFDSVPPGLYGIAFTHPVLDSLPAFPRPLTLNLRPPGVSDVKLGTPGRARAIADVCPDSAMRQSRALSQDTTSANRGVLFGDISFASGDRRSVSVEIRWRRFEVRRSASESVRWRGSGLGAAPDQSGRYVVCGLPIDHPLELELRLNREIIQRDTLRMPLHGIRRLDLRVKQ